MKLIKISIFLVLLSLPAFAQQPGNTASVEVVNSPYATQYFQAARDKWLQATNYRNVEALIEIVSSTVLQDMSNPDKITKIKQMTEQAHMLNQADQSPEQLEKNKPKIIRDTSEFLINLRKPAQVLRSIEKFMDIRHQSTKALDDFTIALGDFKDALKIPENADPEIPRDETVAGKQQRKKAKALLEILAQAPLRSVADDFIPASEENIATYISLHLQELHERLTNPQTETGVSPKGKLMLPDKDFHAIRKIMRDFYSFFELQNEQAPDMNRSSFKKGSKEQEKAIRHMGSKHDSLVQGTMGVKGADKNQLLTVPNSALPAAQSISDRALKTMPTLKQMPDWFNGNKCALLYQLDQKKKK